MIVMSRCPSHEVVPETYSWPVDSFAGSAEAQLIALGEPVFRRGSLHVIKPATHEKALEA